MNDMKKHAEDALMDVVLAAMQLAVHELDPEQIYNLLRRIVDAHDRLEKKSEVTNQ